MYIYIQLNSVLGQSIPWAKVAQEMGNRTDAKCSFRWRQLSSMTDIVKQYALRMAGKALTRNAHLSASVSRLHTQSFSLFHFRNFEVALLPATLSFFLILFVFNTELK